MGWYIQIGSATCRLIGHAKFGGFFPDRIDARIVGMHALGRGFSGAQSLPLIVNFADALGAFFLAAFEFFHGESGEGWGFVSGEIEAAPDLEAVGILRILRVEIVERFAGGHGEDHGLFDVAPRPCS